MFLILDFEFRRWVGGMAGRCLSSRRMLSDLASAQEMFGFLADSGG